MTTGQQVSWPRAAASIAVFRRDDVLLVERGKPPLVGIWSLPGGRIEPGETAAAAALRELDEETGIGARLVGLIDVHEVIARDRTGSLAAHYLIAVYAGVWSGGEPRPGDDARSARFVGTDEIGRLELTAGAAALIARGRALVASG